MRTAFRIALIAALGVATLPVAVLAMKDPTWQRIFRKSPERMMQEALDAEARVREQGLVAAHERLPEFAVPDSVRRATDNPYARELWSSQPATAYRRLMANPDPVARATARWIAMGCAGYSPASIEENRARAMKSATSDEDRARRNVEYVYQANRCVAFTIQDFRRDGGINAERVGPASLFGRMYNEPTTQELLDRLRKVAERKDPITLWDVGNAFPLRKDYRGHYDLPIGNGETIKVSLISEAFQLASCHYGGSCSVIPMAQSCASNGNCADSPEAVLAASHTPEQMKQILAARDVVIAGVETKTWPDGWWELNGGRR